MWLANDSLIFIHHSHTHKKTNRTDKKKTDKPDGKPENIQFSFFFKFFFNTVKLHSLAYGVWGPLREIRNDCRNPQAPCHPNNARRSQGLLLRHRGIVSLAIRLPQSLYDRVCSSVVRKCGALRGLSEHRELFSLADHMQLLRFFSLYGFASWTAAVHTLDIWLGRDQP